MKEKEEKIEEDENKLETGTEWSPEKTRAFHIRQSKANRKSFEAIDRLSAASHAMSFTKPAG